MANSTRQSASPPTDSVQSLNRLMEPSPKTRNHPFGIPVSVLLVRDANKPLKNDPE
jgi:hypothetical protein